MAFVGLNNYTIVAMQNIENSGYAENVYIEVIRS